LGDVEAGFAEADLVVEEDYYTSPCHQAALEPHACLAEVDDMGRITVFTGTQQISVLHTELALSLNLPMTDVKVVAVWLGGGFGGRLKTHLEQICSLLARETRCPVKLVLSREEEFTTTHARSPYSIHMKVGVKLDGAITAKETDILVDAGAYADHVLGTATHAITVSQGPYHIPNCQARARVVVTNNPDWGCMRGYGAHQISFPTELIMDEIASKLGMDPVDFRIKNLCRDGEPILSTQNLRAVTIRETMESALMESRYREKKGQQKANCGIGVANLIHVTGFLSSSAMVRVNEDATVTIITGITEIGCGSHNVLRQIAAEVLGVPVDAVSVVAADTDFAPHDTGSIASRTTYDSGNAVRIAAEDVRNKLVGAAASFLKCNQEEIAVEGGWVFQLDKPDNRLAFNDLVGIALYVTGGPLLGSGSWLAAGSFPHPVGDGYAQGQVGTFLFGTHVAEVEVDQDTGKTRVINYTACHDVGKALNPAGVEGQIEGGVVQGIGGSLFEELQVLEGEITNPSFVDYRLPTALDVPPIKAVYIEHPDPTGPFGAKGVGEPPIMPPAPAIANAIFDATGLQIKKIPITAERLKRAISTRQDQLK
jgi:carbon-monoxide dehydrogenase large subunit